MREDTVRDHEATATRGGRLRRRCGDVRLCGSPLPRAALLGPRLPPAFVSRTWRGVGPRGRRCRAGKEVDVYERCAQ